jgi:hypothetical protein
MFRMASFSRALRTDVVYPAGERADAVKNSLAILFLLGLIVAAVALSTAYANHH